MRERFFKTLLVVGAILFVELALRLFDPIGIEHFREVHRYADALEFGGSYGYLHKPGYRAHLQGVDVVINDFGLRSPPTSIEKPPGTRRLLILGDSIVFGWGAPQDSIFPARLGRTQHAPGARVEVIAAGVASWNTRTEYEWLRARGLAFEPDAVVLVIVGNDVDPKDVGHTDVPVDSLWGPVTRRDVVWRSLRDRWQTGYHDSYILGYVQFARVFLRQRRLESAGYAPDSPQWRDARLALDGIIDTCAAHGIDLVVFLYGDEERVELSGVLRAYRDHLRARGVRPHALPQALFVERRYSNSIVDGHENAAGHAVLARVIGEVVAPIMAGKRGGSE
jgi:lysophospholipase L1-like esterase